MNIALGRLHSCVLLGALHGAVAWAAYAVTEFLFSSVLFGIVRPYAIFTSWHWQLTGLLLGAYLVTGFLAGALAGAALWLLARSPSFLGNSDRAALLESAATLTLVLAFAANFLALPLSPRGLYPLLGLCALFALLLVAALRSRRWSDRLGLLTNPWIISGLLLGLGQVYGLLEILDEAQQFGTRLSLWVAALVATLVVVALAAVSAGRWLRRRLPRDRFSLFAPSWAALASALLLLAGSSWLAASSPAQAQGPAALASDPARPNVLMIVMDTVRPDHLSLYGYPRHTTPNLEKLARDSMVYSRAIAPSDMTLSTHASLFTGLYPGWHAAHCQPPEATYGHPLSPKAATLAEILAARGYTTVGVAGNMYLRADFGLQRGFQVFRIPRPVPVLASESWYVLRRGMRRELSLVADTAQFDRLFSRSEDVNQELFSIPALDRAPLFVFLNYMDAHFPYIPPAPFDRRFPGKIRRLTQDDLEADQQAIIHGRPMPPADRDHCLSQYDGGIAYIDAQIGQVVDWLKQRHAYDNTLIVVTTDHGEAFGERNLVLHGNSAYQNLVHAALLVKFPNSAHKGVSDAPVSLTDVVPTVLATLGYPAPKNVQGRHLLASSAPRKIYTESFPCPVLHPLDCPDGCLTRAIFAWPYKYIASSNGKRELYDLAKDPNETHSLAEATPLAADLKAWVKTMPAQTRQPLSLNPESLRRLKSLGYVQ